MFKFLGLLMVLVSWVSGFYLTRKWRGTRAMSISEHAASHKSAAKLFTLVLVAGGTIFYAWLVAWFVPHLKLSVGFIILLSVTMVAQMIAGVIPDAKGWQKIVHRTAAYGMAVLYLPLSFIIVTAPETPSNARIIGIVCLTYMIGAGLGFLTIKRARPHFLIAQSLYIVAFQLIILSAAYLSV